MRPNCNNWLYLANVNNCQSSLFFSILGVLCLVKTYWHRTPQLWGWGAVLIVWVTGFFFLLGKLVKDLVCRKLFSGFCTNSIAAYNGKSREGQFIMSTTSRGEGEFVQATKQQDVLISQRLVEGAFCYLVWKQHDILVMSVPGRGSILCELPCLETTRYPPMATHKC